ncbi:MAG TPA: hypothetical protein VH482_22280 [Thermomicrobiales bacterium]
MRHRLPYPSPVPLPSPTERAALAVAARYLARAGTATATQLLGGADADATLAAILRDQFEAGAALCRGLLDAAVDDDAWLLRLP